MAKQYKLYVEVEMNSVRLEIYKSKHSIMLLKSVDVKQQQVNFKFLASMCSNYILCLYAMTLFMPFGFASFSLGTLVSEVLTFSDLSQIDKCRTLC